MPPSEDGGELTLYERGDGRVNGKRGVFVVDSRWIGLCTRGMWFTLQQAQCARGPV